MANLQSEGTCYFCGCSAPLAPLEVVARGFANVSSDYIDVESANGGRDSIYESVPLLNAIQRDWQPFSDHFMQGRCDEFLPSLFGAEPPIVGAGSYKTPVVPFHRNAMSTAYNRWMSFWAIDEEWVRHLESGQSLDLETLGTWEQQASEHLKPLIRAFSKGCSLWRARAEFRGFSASGAEPLPPTEMGLNPTCPPSRLNVSGEAVLYCAEAEKTAVAEIRPGRGYFCTVCELRTSEDLQILDLATAAEEVNPFTQSGLSWVLDLRRIAINLSALIAEPISRGEDPAIYLKTQALARLVRAMNLDGIRFSSSLDTSGGVNLGLFRIDAVAFLTPHLVKIIDTKVKYTHVSKEPAGISAS